MKRRGRLSFRIGVLVMALVGAVTAMQALAMRTVISSESLEARRHVVEEGVALARLAARGEGESPRVLREAVGRLERIAVVFYDEDGHLLARSRDDVEIVGTLDASTRAGAIAAGGDPYYLTPLELGSRTAVVASNGAHHPVRFVGVYEDSAALAIARIRTWVPLSIALIGLVTAFLVTWLLVRRVRGAVLDTELVVRRMAQGDLSLRLADAGDDEIGQLVRDFNHMADQLAAHVSRLEGEDQRRRLLLAAFTHEINTPLTSVLGYLESVQMPDIEAEPATRRKYVEIAYQQAQQLSALAEDLTTLSRLEYEGIALDRVPHDLAKVAEEEAEAFGPRALREDVTLRVEGDSTVAPIDRARFGQVLRVLIDNAVRHARKGSVVRLVVRDDDKSVQVVDEGEGIAPEHLTELGTPLYRPDAARDRKRGGRGLGLAIATGLVKAHRGTLTIESTVGSGTLVRVTVGPVD